jgi:hypothetical protein
MAQPTKWHCPVCGSTLLGERIDAHEDDGSPCVVYVFDCPNGDLHLAITEDEVIELMHDLVWERLRSA